jgi:hypothetical protein
MQAAVNQPKRDPQSQARRNVRTALWLALMALGFLLAFVWSVSRHHGG